MGTRGGQQGLRHPQFVFEERVTSLCERSITGDVTVLNGLPHIFKFVPHDRRSIEIYLDLRHTLILADDESEVIQAIIVKQGNILRKVALAMIEEERGIGVI